MFCDLCLKCLMLFIWVSEIFMLVLYPQANIFIFDVISSKMPIYIFLLKNLLLGEYIDLFKIKLWVIGFHYMGIS